MIEFKLIYGLDGYSAAKDIREKVFCNEQGIAFDKDDKDSIAWHIVGSEKGKVIAAARMYNMADGIFCIGRVCVDKDYRGMYVGDTLMRALEDKAVQLKGRLVNVSSQEQAVGFYEKEGYEKYTEAYIEAGIKHYSMRKDLSKPHKRCECCSK